jgi:hypothetical protein
MGMLVNGEWRDWYDTSGTGDRFVLQDSASATG